MAYNTGKTEHSGAKRGKGYWGRKKEAKKSSNVARRRQDKSHELSDKG